MWKASPGGAIECVLQLRVYLPRDRALDGSARLGALPGVRHVVVGGRTVDGLVELTGDIDPDRTATVLDALHDIGLPAGDVVLSRVPSIQPLGLRHRRPMARWGSTDWADVRGRADEHARLGLIYMLYMAAAGVIAG